MSRPALIALAILLFGLLATANAGGYRYGASDQAFYVPAISLRANPDLFPKDRGVFEPQMRLWLGDEVLGRLVRLTGVSLPSLFAGLYILTVVAFALGAIALARALGFDWWTIAIALLLLTLRHRIARTGANSFEGYMHPRMLAFGVGLLALAAITRGRLVAAVAWTAAAAMVHTSTALWFAGVVAIALVWRHPQRTRLLAAGLGVSVGLVAMAYGVFPEPLAPMDAAWLAVLADRDYLFSAEWPLWAWGLNLSYAIVILEGYRRRKNADLAMPHESALVAGLLALVTIFFVTLPLVEARIPFFVQLQANRVFWLLDAVAVLYLAWLLMAGLGRQWTRTARLVMVAIIAVASVSRAVYVLHVETNRPLIQATLPANHWTEIMAWLRTQPSSWHVLADPAHVWKFGSSVRVAALRDTLLESGKDPAMAMYDHALAMRVSERTAALAHFDTLSLDDVRRLDATYDLDVFIDRADRQFALPTLFRNRDFVAYDLR